MVQDIKTVAIVEDDGATAELFEAYFLRHAQETSCGFSVTKYSNGEDFLESYGAGFDLVLMDIELPGLNGMETIRRLRERDKKTIVIFATNLAQYAIKGYEVEAFDFIVKPITYFNFSVRLKRAMQRMAAKTETEFWISVVGEGKQKIKSSALKYVEVMDHKLVFHTTEGNYESNASLLKAREFLRGAPFALCNRCYFVNLAFVTGTWQYEVYLGDETLQMSHLKRNEFLRKLNVYLSGGTIEDDN